MTAVIYARYSSDSQREASIEGQLRDCKDYAEKNGITVVGTYIDRAYSAKTDDRPDFQRMIKDSGKKIFDVVLVWKLDRFARNRYDAVNYKSDKERVRTTSSCTFSFPKSTLLYCNQAFFLPKIVFQPLNGSASSRKAMEIPAGLMLL